MIISLARAYEILSSYRIRGTRLAFGGAISGEQANCSAAVWSVAPELGTVTIKLLSESEEKSWYRAIPLEGAAFFFAEEGDPAALHMLAGTQFSAVLIIDFPDGTALFMAESAPTGSSLL
jgi:hypothetical protein